MVKHFWEGQIPFTRMPDGRLVLTDLQIAAQPVLARLVADWGSNVFTHDPLNGWYVYDPNHPF